MTTRDEQLLMAWGAFFVSHALSVRRIAVELQGKAPLTLDEYEILLVTSRSPEGKIRLASLADATIFTRSGITRVADRMVQRGFLRREGCPNDKRGAYAALTSEGKEALKETWKHYSKSILAIFSPCFSLEEAHHLYEMLDRLALQLRDGPLVNISPKKISKKKRSAALNQAKRFH